MSQEEERRLELYLKRKELEKWALLRALRDTVILLHCEMTGVSPEAARAALDERAKNYLDRFLLNLEDEDPAQSAALDDESAQDLPPPDEPTL